MYVGARRATDPRHSRVIPPHSRDERRTPAHHVCTSRYGKRKTRQAHMKRAVVLRRVFCSVMSLRRAARLGHLRRLRDILGDRAPARRLHDGIPSERDRYRDGWRDHDAGKPDNLPRPPLPTYRARLW